MAKPRKKSVSEQREDKRLKAAVRVFSETGDGRCAAKLLGRTLDAAYRTLCHPDGISALESLCARDKGAYWSLDRAQRKALLSMAAVGGVLPEVRFSVDENGNIRSGADQLTLVPIPASQRAKFLELLGRMEGDYLDRHEHKIIETHDDWVTRFSSVDVTPVEEDIDPLS